MHINSHLRRFYAFQSDIYISDRKLKVEMDSQTCREGDNAGRKSSINAVLTTGYCKPMWDEEDQRYYCCYCGDIWRRNW